MPSNDNSAPESSDIFYRTGEKLPSVFSKDPFKACITPRPIGWISVSSQLRQKGEERRKLPPNPSLRSKELSMSPYYVSKAELHQFALLIDRPIIQNMVRI